MEVINADMNAMANVVPERKKRGRKPKVFLDNKPIDPKYYVNYYHDVIKQKEHLCPYCNKKFACQNNVNKHLKQSSKPCAVTYLQSLQTEHEESDTDSEDIRAWSDYYHKPHFLDIPQSSPINKWLSHMEANPEPKNDAEWFQAGWLMINMMLESQKHKE